MREENMHYNAKLGYIKKTAAEYEKNMIKLIKQNGSGSLLKVVGAQLVTKEVDGHYILADKQ